MRHLWAGCDPNGRIFNASAALGSGFCLSLGVLYSVDMTEKTLGEGVHVFQLSCPEEWSRVQILAIFGHIPAFVSVLENDPGPSANPNTKCILTYVKYNWHCGVGAGKNGPAGEYYFQQTGGSPPPRIKYVTKCECAERAQKLAVAPVPVQEYSAVKKGHSCALLHAQKASENDCVIYENLPTFSY